MYIFRQLDLQTVLKTHSCFLWGPRQTGKSTYLKCQGQSWILKTFQLLEQGLALRLNQNPQLLRESLQGLDPNKGVVVIDEIQKCPILLDEIHLLIEDYGFRFLMTGSNARKLKRPDTNLLGGRAFVRNFHGLVYPELITSEVGFDLMHVINKGKIPSFYLSPDPSEALQNYVYQYLEREVVMEGATRNIPAFSRFLNVAALYNGQLLNYSHVASDSQVNRQTVQNYFQILKDTLVGFDILPYKMAQKRKSIGSVKFYFFDMGVVKALRQLKFIEPKSKDFGDFFEHFIALEVKAYLDYNKPFTPLNFWRDQEQVEVDFIVDNLLAIEVKSSSLVNGKDHTRGLRAFKKENQEFKKFILVSCDPIRRTQDGIEFYPYEMFLKELWAGQLI